MVWLQAMPKLGHGREYMGLSKKYDPDLVWLPVLAVLIDALNDLKRLGPGSED